LRLTAYALVFGGLLICGGRVADVFGHRRIFLIGLGLFTVASVGCALAWSTAALVAARVVQGAGAALLSPAALAMLTTLTKPGEERRRRRLVDGAPRLGAVPAAGCLAV